MVVKKLLVVALLFVGFASAGQTQLVLIHRQKVVARYVYGDNFEFKLKNSSGYKNGLITDIKEFSVILYNDTVPFASIEKVSLRGQSIAPLRGLVSKFLITAGLVYFTLDQFNNVVVHQNKADLEPTVWKPALAMVAAGYGIRYIRKRSQRIRFPAKLIAVERGSPFYLSVE